MTDASAISNPWVVFIVTSLLDEQMLQKMSRLPSFHNNESHRLNKVSRLQLKVPTTTAKIGG